MPTRIYFYHTRVTEQSYQEWKDHKFPGHLLYGMPLFEKDGIESVMHNYKFFPKRWQLMLYTTKEILRNYSKFNLVYGTSFRGLELIIFLRAIGLFRKPIVVWHHTAITKSSSKIKETISRLFYKGIDKMFLFSDKLIDDSMKSEKVPSNKLKLVHWGPDIDFYDYITQSIPEEKRVGFISTGKENRDVVTLIDAFNKTDKILDIYISKECGEINYEKRITSANPRENISVSYTEGVIPLELAKKVAFKECIIIPCLEFPYTVGLTTLVEAFALGMPVICSRNPNFQMDIDKEGIGITVEYGDVKGWIDAINYMSENPQQAREMGKRARKLAEERFNLKIFAHEIAEVLLSVSSKKR